MFTQRTPHELVFGSIPGFPTEVKHGSWRLIDWTKVQNQADLLQARLKMLHQKQENVEQACAKAITYREVRASYL